MASMRMDGSCDFFAAAGNSAWTAGGSTLRKFLPSTMPNVPAGAGGPTTHESGDAAGGCAVAGPAAVCSAAGGLLYFCLSPTGPSSPKFELRCWLAIAGCRSIHR
jgi:hypothetical protein